MRTTKKSGNFLLSLLLNLLLNFEWSIPAWVLLIFHFTHDISIVWFIVAISVWFLIMIVSMSMIRWASKCSNLPKEERENKNPYSVKKADEENQE